MIFFKFCFNATGFQTVPVSPGLVVTRGDWPGAPLTSFRSLSREVYVSKAFRLKITIR